MQWRRHETAEIPAKLQIIDLSKVTAPFRYVTWATYALFFVGVFLVRDAAIAVLTTQPTRAEVTGRLIELTLGAYWAWTAARNVSVLSTVKGLNIYIALLLMAVPSMLGALVFGLSLNAYAHGVTKGASLPVVMVLFVLFLLAGCFSLMGLLALVRSRVVHLPSGSVRLKHLLTDPLFQSEHRVPKLPAQNAKTGAGYIALALIVLIGGGVLSRFARMFGGDAFFLGVPVSLTVGYGFLIMARQCFEPTFDAVMSLDQRAPVLFLRSFFDDVRMDKKTGERALLDFSLETRLARHFHEFGPFIAIGAPSEAGGGLEAKTHLGAARVQLGDDEWQEKVTKWMDDSAFIVCMVGWSHWVTWEMKTIMERMHMGKLLLVFPDTKLRGQSRTYDIEDRLARIHEAFQGTAWEETLKAMGTPPDICCLSLGPQGQVTAIVSRSRTRSAYELSALVCHAGLLGLYGTAAREAETVALNQVASVG